MKNKTMFSTKCNIIFIILLQCAFSYLLRLLLNEQIKIKIFISERIKSSVNCLPNNLIVKNVCEQ